jgi:hypothetical protein
MPREPRSVLPPEQRVITHHDLCLHLGGDPTSFTGDLLRLIAKADPGNRAALRLAFPVHVATWETWMTGQGQLTSAELAVIAEMHMRDTW